MVLGVFRVFKGFIDFFHKSLGSVHFLCINYISHELNSHPFIIGYIVIIIYLAIIIVFVGFHSKVDTQLSHSMWIKFFYLSTRYIKFIIKILSRYSYARWNDRVFSVLICFGYINLINFNLCKYLSFQWYWRTSGQGTK